MSFWNKTTKDDKRILNSDEYERASKRIIELHSRVEELQNKIAVLQTNYDNLRGQFNRKLSGIKEEEKKVEMTESETNIKKNIFLSPDGSII